MTVIPIGNARLASVPRDSTPDTDVDRQVREWTGVLTLRTPIMCVSCETEPASEIYDFATPRPLPVCRRCSPTPIRARRLELVHDSTPGGVA